MSDGEVRYRPRGRRSSTVTFDRPAARNAMTWRMYQQLGEACARMRAGRRRARRGVSRRRRQVLHRRHRHRAVPGFRTGEDGIAYEEKMEGYHRRHRGAADADAWPWSRASRSAAGSPSRRACDLRIATPGSRFGVPIARTLGNCLSMANYARLVAALGASRAKRDAAAGGEPHRRGGAGRRLPRRDRASPRTSTSESPSSRTVSRIMRRSPCA